MKHEWATPRYASAAEAYQAGEQRVCAHCGARQKLHRDHAWMRVVKRQWLPLVGRCGPKAKRCAYFWERRAAGMRYVFARGQCKRTTAHASGYCSAHKYMRQPERPSRWER